MNYKPDYAEPPGSTLEEALEERGMSQADLARRTGLSAKHISQIVNGKASLTPETAARLEEVLGIRASLWNRLEANYQEGLLRLEAAVPSEDQLRWLKTLPVAELKKRGYLPDTRNKAELIVAARRFFRVASEAAWDAVTPQPPALLRQSAAHPIDRAALGSWLEIVRRRASSMTMSGYDEDRFRSSLVDIRAESTSARTEIGTWLEETCASSGVRLVIEPEIAGSRVSGAAFWLHSVQPVLALSLRGKRDDKVWFSLFHEAGHLLLHAGNRDKQWIDDDEVTVDGIQETQADIFARDWLINGADAERLEQIETIEDAKTFSAQIGISPGIAIGRIQRERSTRNNRSFSIGNDLKRTVEFGPYDRVRDRWPVLRGKAT